MPADHRNSIRQFLDGHGAPLIRAFRVWIGRHAPAIIPAVADHLCYRCGDSDDFDEIRGWFEAVDAEGPVSRFIYQSIVAGRRIAVIRLIEPIPTPLGDLRFLELADPKPKSSMKGDFHHIEIYPTSGTPEELVACLSRGPTAGIVDGRFRIPSFRKVIRPHHTTWDAEMDGGFIIRVTEEPLIDKIKRTEML